MQCCPSESGVHIIERSRKLRLRRKPLIYRNHDALARLGKRATSRIKKIERTAYEGAAMRPYRYRKWARAFGQVHPDFQGTPISAGNLQIPDLADRRGGPCRNQRASRFAKLLERNILR